MRRQNSKWLTHEERNTDVPMRGEGADGLVVVMKPGNAGGAKQPDDRAEDADQPAMGGWVKANGGAAGVDGESLTMFEQDLKGNLYKSWNRMSSGSYFPPPVRLVEIPKGDGGTRALGIPAVGDRVARTTRSR